MTTLFYYASLLRYGTFALALAPIITQYWFLESYFSALFMAVVVIFQLMTLKVSEPRPIPLTSPLTIAVEFVMVPGTVIMVALSLHGLDQLLMQVLILINTGLFALSCLTRGTLMLLRRMDIIPSE